MKLSGAVPLATGEEHLTRMMTNSPNAASSLNKMKIKNMTSLPLRKSIGRPPLRLGLPRVQPLWIIRGFLLIPLVLGCFALSPTARALLPPPAPDGGYPGLNTAEGDSALFNLTTGIYNTATGFAALYSNTEGDNNTAYGVNALGSNTAGTGNTANGYNALVNTTGNFNIALGFGAGYNLTTGDNNIDIGNKGVAAEANTIRIGTAGTQTNTYIAGINGVSLTGAPVVVDAAGHLGTADISTLQGPPGPIGPEGPTGVGLVQGGVLCIRQGFAAPAGFTKIGTYTFNYKDLPGHSRSLTTDIYTKN